MRHPDSTSRLAAGTLVLWLGLPLVLLAQEPPESPCPDGQTFTAAQPIETPLPALDVVSDGCESFETPTVSFLVGHDGQTYYVDFEPSTTCSAADEELSRWILCWTYEPARCGSEPELSTVETAVEWTGGEGGDEPPCDRAIYETYGGGE